MSDELLAQANQPGGSLEEKIQSVMEVFRNSARHRESIQQVLRRRALERRQSKGAEAFPDEVEEVISQGTYLDAFLEAYDGQSFELFSEEIVPSHSYTLALEVHSGGAYWSSIQAQDTAVVRHKVETVGASSAAEGSASILSQFGAAQRGAVFVWRWSHMIDQGPYSIPEWLAKILCGEGNDPLRKLQGELEAIQRWEQQVRQDTAKKVKVGGDVKDPYIREVLRLWPTEPDPHGGEQLKKCAWVEGLDHRLFVGRTVLVCRIPFDGQHALQLHAAIAKRHSEDAGPADSNPPYRLTATWQWAAHNASAGRPVDARPSSAASLTSEMTRPGTTSSEITRPGTIPGDLARPGTAMTDLSRPGTIDQR